MPSSRFSCTCSAMFSDELLLVHLIRQLGDDYADLRSVPELLKLRARADYHLAAPGGVGRADAAAAHDYAPGGEIGPLTCSIRSESVASGLSSTQMQASITSVQVVRRDVRRHADGDAAASR